MEPIFANLFEKRDGTPTEEVVCYTCDCVCNGGCNPPLYDTPQTDEDGNPVDCPNNCYC